MEVLTKAEFVHVGIVYNAFDTSDIQRDTILYTPNQPLSVYLEGLPTECDWRIGLNGKPVEESALALTVPKANDVISLVVIPRGGGAKDILRMVALVALAVVAMYVLGPGGLAGLSGIVALMATAAAVAIGGYLINTLLPPTMPKAGKEEGTNYGYDGAKNTAKEGVAIPVVYGTFRVAGNYVDMFTENVDDSQYLYGRTILSDGEIDSVTDIEINDQPIADFQSVTYGTTPGSNSDAVNPNFGRAISQQAKNVKLTTSYTNHTTTTAVDAIQFNIGFPGGLVHAQKDGDKVYLSVTVEYSWKLSGSGTWTTEQVTYTNNTIKTMRRTFETPALARGIYDTRVTRITADSTSERDSDDVFLVDVGEIQRSNVAVRSIATGWYKILMTDQLQSVPNITWKVKGVKVNQYNSSGGLVTKAWSSNPAWIVLDMLIGEDRGAFPDSISIDWQAFSDWAAYCNANGFLFNGVFDTTRSLWDTLAEVYKVGRAMPLRIGTKLSVAIDAPAEPVMMFGAGNIEKDTFEISYLPLDDRANEFEVSYYDKDDRNKQKTIRIVDPDAEARGEIPRPAQYTLMGIDNFEQAQKEVWYQLYQNRLARRVVTFQAPIESIGLTIGDVALIQHDMVDWGISGRLQQGISTTQVKVDKAVTSADGDTLLVIHDVVDGETDVIEERTVTAVDPVNNIITVSPAFSVVPGTGSNYMFGESNNVYRPFRLRSISGDDLYSRSLSFVEYHPAIYGPPEQVIPAPGVRPGNVLAQVRDLQFASAYDYNDTATKDVITNVSWQAGHILNYAGADIHVAQVSMLDYNAGATTPNYKLHSSVTGTQLPLIFDYGQYVWVKVVAYNSKGIRANFDSAPFIDASITDPIVLSTPTITSDGTAVDHTIVGDLAQISFEWVWPSALIEIDGFYIKVQTSDTSDFASHTTETFTASPANTGAIFGGANPDKYYKFSVQAFKRVHDIFNPDGYVESTEVFPSLSTENPYQPSANTAYVGDIKDTVTDPRPLIVYLDFLNFSPPVEGHGILNSSLTNPSAFVPVDRFGLNAVYSNTGTFIHVLESGVALAYNAAGATPGTWTVTSSGTSVTPGAITDGGAYAVAAPITSMNTSAAVIEGSVTFSISGQYLNGEAFTATLTQKIVKEFGAVIDNTAPPIPSGLTLSSAISTDASGNQLVRLTANWTALTTQDLGGYVLDIKEGTGAFVSFPATADQTSYSWNVLAGTLYTVKIRAFDLDHNYSGSSADVTHTTGADTTVPNAPTSLTILSAFTDLYLSWTNPTQNTNASSLVDLAAIKVYENTTNTSGTATLIATVNAIAGLKGAYARSGLDTGVTRYYWIKAVDTSGNESAFSTVASATTVQIGPTNIADDAITTPKLAAGAVTANEIAANTILGTNISTSTSLPGTITVGLTGVSLSTIQTQANDPAARVNANSTLITPGKIQITGSTSLTSWINGGDNTKIEGGAIAANTIAANKLKIGDRNLNYIGIEFQYNAGTLSWTTGFVLYTNDAGAQVVNVVNAGSVTWGGGAYNYIYWTKGADGTNVNLGRGVDNWDVLRNTANTVILCTWTGNSSTFVANYGGTIVHGDKITTGSVTADKLTVSQLSAITATIGTLRTATTGARTEIRDNLILVYDASNVLRVRIGVW